MARERRIAGAPRRFSHFMNWQIPMLPRLELEDTAQPTLKNLFLAILMASIPLNTCLGQEQDPTSLAHLKVFDATEFKKHVAYLASDELEGRAPGSAGWAKAAEYVIGQFKDSGLSPLQANGSWFQEFPLKAAHPVTGSLFGKNILAKFPGRGPLKDEAVVISAHYDHLGTLPPDGREHEDRIYNGADDNASGVAALLLNAKALTQQRDLLGDSYRTVIFASFDAEEQGLKGAKSYAQRPLWPLGKTVAVINFDCVGRLRAGKFFASDAETNPILAQVVRDAAKQRGVIGETHFGGHGRSDHAVFLRLGIPGVHFFTGASIDYHRVSDHLDKVNCDGGAIISEVSFDVLRWAMTYSEKLEFKTLDASIDVQAILKLLANLGIVPNVNAQEGRYPQILFVTPKSPAANHGLKSGDQITALNGIQFSRVEDAITIFQQLTFDEGLNISVLREDKRTEVQPPAKLFEDLFNQGANPDATE